MVVQAGRERRLLETQCRSTGREEKQQKQKPRGAPSHKGRHAWAWHALCNKGGEPARLQWSCCVEKMHNHCRCRRANYVPTRNAAQQPAAGQMPPPLLCTLKTTGSGGGGPALSNPSLGLVLLAVPLLSKTILVVSLPLPLALLAAAKGIPEVAPQPLATLLLLVLLL